MLTGVEGKDQYVLWHDSMLSEHYLISISDCSGHQWSVVPHGYCGVEGASNPTYLLSILLAGIKYATTK